MMPKMKLTFRKIDEQQVKKIFHVLRFTLNWLSFQRPQFHDKGI